MAFGIEIYKQAFNQITEIDFYPKAAIDPIWRTQDAGNNISIHVVRDIL